MVLSLKKILSFIGAIKIIIIGFIAWLCLVLFVFSFGSKPNNYKDLSSVEQSYELMLEKSRDSLRGFFGKIVPMKPKYFRNLTPNQKERLPKPEKALVQLSDREIYRLQKMGKNYRRSQENISKLIKALVQHFKS